MRRLLVLVLVCSVCSLPSIAGAQREGEVSVPAGTFTMGTDDGRVDALMARFGSKRRELFAAEVPAHAATVRAFLIDRTEVTNAAFKTFVDAHQEWSRDRLAETATTVST